MSTLAMAPHPCPVVSPSAAERHHIIKRVSLFMASGVPLDCRVCVASALDENAMVMNLRALKTTVCRVALPLLNQPEQWPVALDPFPHPVLEQLVTAFWPPLVTAFAQQDKTLQWLQLGLPNGYRVERFACPTPPLPDVTPLAAEPGAAAAAMLLLTRQYEFSASHRLYNPALTAEENWATFLECNNPNGHGHNYTLEVMLAGEPDPVTGMILNVLVLDEVVKTLVVDPMDHKHLNYDVPFLQGEMTTAENVARVVFHRLAPHIPAPAWLYGVRLHESRSNSAEYYANPVAVLPSIAP